MSFFHGILNRFPVLAAVWRVVLNRKNPEFIEFINGIKDNANIVMVHPKSVEKYDGKPICMVRVGTKNDGFFACVRWALDGLYFCDQIGCIPYVVYPDNSIYSDHKVFKEDINPFNYFFESTINEPIENIQALPQIGYYPRNALLAERLNGGISYAVSERYIDQMSIIMRKYLHFNTDVKKYINKYISALEITDNILGVHIRGTDYRSNYKNHPVFLGSEDYYEKIDGALKKHGFKKLFLATDDEILLDEFIRHYGEEQIIYSKNVERGRGQVGIHTNQNKTKTPYYLGLDVIGDMCALSSCGGIVSGMSQVSLIARIYKKSCGEEYLYDCILNKGINDRGRIYKNRNWRK